MRAGHAAEPPHEEIIMKPTTVVCVDTKSKIRGYGSVRYGSDTTTPFFRGLEHWPMVAATTVQCAVEQTRRGCVTFRRTLIRIVTK